eukprot:g19073.t1
MLPTGKVPKCPGIQNRLKKVDGKRVNQVLGKVKYQSPKGELTYGASDLKYDIQFHDDPECPSMEIPLDPELVRGVPLHHCLRGLGHHWRRQSAGADLDLSQKTEHIDYFLSHDWETSRLLKWMTLLVMFNAPAAAVVTLIVTGVMIPFSVFGFIPYQLVLWQPLVGHLSYLIMLLIWQDLRRLCRKPLLVFLDKLCIAQRETWQRRSHQLGL